MNLLTRLLNDNSSSVTQICLAPQACSNTRIKNSFHGDRQLKFYRTVFFHGSSRIGLYPLIKRHRQDSSSSTIKSVSVFQQITATRTVYIYSSSFVTSRVQSSYDCITTMLDINSSAQSASCVYMVGFVTGDLTRAH